MTEVHRRIKIIIDISVPWPCWEKSIVEKPKTQMKYLIEINKYAPKNLSPTVKTVVRSLEIVAKKC